MANSAINKHLKKIRILTAQIQQHPESPAVLANLQAERKAALIALHASLEQRQTVAPTLQAMEFYAAVSVLAQQSFLADGVTTPDTLATDEKIYLGDIHHHACRLASKAMIAKVNTGDLVPTEPLMTILANLKTLEPEKSHQWYLYLRGRLIHAKNAAAPLQFWVNHDKSIVAARLQTMVRQTSDAALSGRAGSIDHKIRFALLNYFDPERHNAESDYFDSQKAGNILDVLDRSHIPLSLEPALFQFDINNPEHHDYLKLLNVPPPPQSCVIRLRNAVESWLHSCTQADFLINGMFDPAAKAALQGRLGLAGLKQMAVISRQEDGDWYKHVPVLEEARKIILRNLGSFFNQPQDDTTPKEARQEICRGIIKHIQDIYKNRRERDLQPGTMTYLADDLAHHLPTITMAAESLGYDQSAVLQLTKPLWAQGLRIINAISRSYRLEDKLSGVNMANQLYSGVQGIIGSADDLEACEKRLEQIGVTPKDLKHIADIVQYTRDPLLLELEYANPADAAKIADGFTLCLTAQRRFAKIYATHGGLFDANPTPDDRHSKIRADSRATAAILAQRGLGLQMVKALIFYPGLTSDELATPDAQQANAADLDKVYKDAPPAEMAHVAAVLFIAQRDLENYHPDLNTFLKNPEIMKDNQNAGQNLQGMMSRLVERHQTMSEADKKIFYEAYLDEITRQIPKDKTRQEIVKLSCQYFGFIKCQMNAGINQRLAQMQMLQAGGNSK